jgi:hypothetical protein
VEDELDVMSGTYHVPMSQVFDGALSPTPHFCEIKGRAAEIARALGSAAGGAEHLFLGMLHDGGWPVSVISGLVDLGRAEAAVLGIVNGPGYSPPPPPRFPMREGHVRMWGAEVAFDMGDSYIGVEHAFLAMIRTPETVPARALAGLADLDALEAAVLRPGTPRPQALLKMRCSCPKARKWTARCGGQSPTPCLKTPRIASTALKVSTSGYR